MKIISNNAAAALFAKAEELNHQSTEGWKCIYFKIPDAQERAAHSMPQFDADVIMRMLTRKTGFVYLCDNEEMFILYRGAHQTLGNRLSMYLWTLYSDQETAESPHQLFSFFDLNAQWPSFYRFCEKRYMETLAASGFPHIETLIPVELLLNDHVAGYIGGK